ncbi:MAG: hypothetical protein M3436_13090 [Pseudomonadota bacterium]|nr:hypothetical protein [Pseudomonadota bacterium]
MTTSLPVEPILTMVSASRVIERETADDTLDLAGLAVALAVGDFTREDDVFEIEDREVVIV